MPTAKELGLAAIRHSEALSSLLEQESKPLQSINLVPAFTNNGRHHLSLATTTRMMNRIVTRVAVPGLVQASSRRHARQLLSATAATRLYSSSAFLAAGASVEKLGTILEEYRLNNFSREIPSRFIKELVKGVDLDNDGFIQKEEAIQFLKVIGADTQLSEDEVMEIIQEWKLPNPCPVDVLQDSLMDAFVKKTK